ncbi:MAG: toprim domain-containing protein [Planctomycetales bacterium]|nr:toprim domain-containing protein [Planctomycetales bacterium]
MNIEQAKKISLSSFLGRLGYEPVVNRQGQLWYLSPLRHESQPSFKVNPELNAWYDFAEGKGGDIIDFVKHHQRVSTVSDALACINQVQGDVPLAKQEILPFPKRKQEPAIELDSIGPVKSKSLLAYLKKRGISIPLAAGRLQEAHYHCGDKSYFGLAFANDAGGYELRNPMWKGTLGTKDITTIPGTSTENVSVFEGFFDYLTAITMNRGQLDETAIILNSVAFRGRAAEKLRSWGTKSISLFRDDDAAGAALVDYFISELPDTVLNDMADHYRGHGDLNEWHCEECLNGTLVLE